MGAEAGTTAEYAKNIANWGLDQIFWLSLLCGLFVIMGFVIKKKVMEAVGTAVGVAILCYFLKNPETLSNIGTKLIEIIGLARVTVGARVIRSCKVVMLWIV